MDKQQQQQQQEPEFPIANLGLIAAIHAMPVVGCAEGQSVFPKLGLKIGCLLTAYDKATGPDRMSYSECKRLKNRGGFKCMAPVFPGVSVLRDYQYITSALKDYIDQCLVRAPSEEPSHLVIQRCRGSEVEHTFDVWTGLLDLGGFWDFFDSETDQIVRKYETDPEELAASCEDYGLTLRTCKVYHSKVGCGKESRLLCTIYFRGGWEPKRIRILPDQCLITTGEVTVFLWGTCCRFTDNCKEGDVLIPTVSLKYDVKNRLLSKTPEKPLPEGDYFQVNKRRIWSGENQKFSAKIILYGASQVGPGFICGNVHTFTPAYDWEDIKPAIHIQLSDIFEAPGPNDNETSTFTVVTAIDKDGNPLKKQRSDSDDERPDA